MIHVSFGFRVCKLNIIFFTFVFADGEGVTFSLDRFDPGGGLSTSTGALTSGDIAVPLKVNDH